MFSSSNQAANENVAPAAERNIRGKNPPYICKNAV
jgi:hypothetical protein